MGSFFATEFQCGGEGALQKLFGVRGALVARLLRYLAKSVLHKAFNLAFVGSSPTITHSLSDHAITPPLFCCLQLPELTTTGFTENNITH